MSSKPDPVYLSQLESELLRPVGDDSPLSEVKVTTPTLYDLVRNSLQTEFDKWESYESDVIKHQNGLKIYWFRPHYVSVYSESTEPFTIEEQKCLYSIINTGLTARSEAAAKERKKEGHKKAMARFGY